MAVCPKCGCELPDGTFYCSVCGAKLNPSNTAQGASRQEPPPPPGPGGPYHQEAPWSQGGSYPPPHPPQQSWHPYTQQPWQQPTAPPNEETLSVGKWIGIMMLLSIGGSLTCGILPIVLLCVWGFGRSTSQTLRNFARAALIILLVEFVVAVVAILIVVAVCAFNSISIGEIIGEFFTNPGMFYRS